MALGPVGGETVGGLDRRGNAQVTFPAEKAPKGESYERCRHEKRPARFRREKAVEGVAKPQGRNEAGRLGPRHVDLRNLMCCKETKAHGRSRRAAARGLGTDGQNSRGRLNSKRGSAECFAAFSRRVPRDRPRSRGEGQRQGGIAGTNNGDTFGR